MIKYGILGAILILVATAVVATFRSSDPQVPASLAQATSFPSSDFEERIAALEEAVVEEREQRLRLEAEILNLKQAESNAAVEAVPANGRLAALVGEDGLPEDLQNIREQIEERRNAARGNTEERQLESLVAAGFDEYQAEEIIRQTEEMQMTMLNARFEASQSGEDFNAGEMQAQAVAEFRADLGEQDYERYLEATNQSTSIGVSNVLASSPAEIAGMQTGDEIVSYNGERVFNTNDLNRLTNSSDASGNVIVEVIRDGETISLSLPEGPIGITSGRGNRGR
ncbi:MAG: PDZ domain-containing protein [Porticoccaceae bacterium]|nr:PDZ domain-containing protein [Porticoccaceae bacterium]